MGAWASDQYRIPAQPDAQDEGSDVAPDEA